ncbi:MAG: type I asparaginase [Flavobacteriaceae bacterium]
MSKTTRILLIYTGGTIGMVMEYQTGALKPFNFNKLVEQIPELSQLDCTIHSVSFKRPLDSSNMNPTHWIQIAEIIEKYYEEYDGFVVLHGSDTMSYTSSALSYMLENLGKPVIFTGSQLPIGDLRTDAKENLITSIHIAGMQKRNRPLIREVCLYFEYKLYRANRTTKVNAEHFEAFMSPNYPPLAESGVHIKVNEEDLWEPAKKRNFTVHKKLDDRVAIFKLFPGFNEQLLKGILRIPDLKAVILETYGAGNAPTDQWFIDELSNAKKRGLHIVNVTQCSGGGVNMGRYETSASLRRLQIINGSDITTEGAITKLMYLLGREISPTSFKTVFETSIRGEMS